jgi:hypothetical protein
VGGVFNDHDVPAEVRAACDDPAVVEALADVFRRNCRQEDGAKRLLTAEEARALARAALERLCDPRSLQMADVGGLRFYLQLDNELYPGPNLILANAWDGVQWRPVGRIELPGGHPAAAE